MSGQGFIGRCVEPARETQRMYGVPASVTIAQAILESGWGGSELATRANNYFGIKCAAVASPHQIGCIDKATWEHLNGNDVTMTASFRRYASMRDSFLDHGLFLTKPRYAAAFKAATPDEFAHEIWRAGYATDPQYPAKLVRLMDQYELRQYDDPKQQEAPMPKVFLSPSDQDDNPVHGGGHEQQYAQVRCRVAADVLRNSGIDVKVSEAGIGDDSGGYAASVREGEAWGPDLYIADHSNAVGGAVKRRGIHMYTWPGDLDGRRLAQLIIDEVRPIFGGPDYPTAILNGSHLYEVNGPSATVVFMELGFHDHPEDAAIIRTRSVEIGAAVGRAIAKYYGKATQPSPQEDDMTPDQDRMLKEVHEALRRGQAGSHPAGHIPGQLTSFENMFRPAEAGRLSEDGDILARLKRIEARLDTAKPPAVELDGTLADLSAVVETAVRRVLDDASATIRFSAPATEN